MHTPAMHHREPTLDSLVRRAVTEFNLIQPGDRIVLGASGGKDSTALAWALSRLYHAMDKSFSITAVHVATDLGVNAPLPELRAMFASWGIPLVEIQVPVKARLKEGRSMNCYWCSTQRRTDLIRWALANDHNVLALGHHLDDVLETLLMNMMQKGVLSAMPLRMDYDKYPLRLIRPLGLVEEAQVIRWIATQELGSVTCTCPFGTNSRRKDVRNRLAILTDGFPGAKLRMLRSLSKQNPRYLPGCTATNSKVQDSEAENYVV